MPYGVYYEVIKCQDGRYMFEIKSEGNNVPLAVSANFYSSQDECEQAATDGLELKRSDRKKEF